MEIVEIIQDYIHIINQFLEKKMDILADLKIKELKEILEKYLKEKEQ